MQKTKEKINFQSQGVFINYRCVPNIEVRREVKTLYQRTYSQENINYLGIEHFYIVTCPLLNIYLVRSPLQAYKEVDHLERLNLKKCLALRDRTFLHCPLAPLKFSQKNFNVQFIEVRLVYWKKKLKFFNVPYIEVSLISRSVEK